MFLKRRKTHQVNILCRSQRATCVSGVFTEVQEIIRLFTVSDCAGGGAVPGGAEAGGGGVAVARQVSCLRLQATVTPFVIKFESFNKIKQPEKCSCRLLKSTKGITVLKKGSEVSSRECVKENKTSGGKPRLSVTPLRFRGLPSPVANSLETSNALGRKSLLLGQCCLQGPAVPPPHTGHTGLPSGSGLQQTISLPRGLCMSLLLLIPQMLRSLTFSSLRPDATCLGMSAISTPKWQPPFPFCPSVCPPIPS